MGNANRAPYKPATMSSSKMLDEEAWMLAMDTILSRFGRTTVEASEVTPYMLIGGKPAAEDAMNKNRQRFTHVLNCAEPWVASGPNYSELKYTGFEAYDEVGYNMLDKHYADAKPFLEDARLSGGRCLVHCAMGVNRSACICVAYLIDAIG